jgi:threonine/homoserine/homoserine lactone efflux protein
LDLVGREVIPHEERTRRGLLWALGIAYVLLFFLSVGFALVLSADDYQKVGTAIQGFTAVLSAGLGAAFAFYFQGKRHSD